MRQKTWCRALGAHNSHYLNTVCSCSSWLSSFIYSLSANCAAGRLECEVFLQGHILSTAVDAFTAAPLQPGVKWRA
jgi:hypothetical protein